VFRINQQTRTHFTFAFRIVVAGMFVASATFVFVQAAQSRLAEPVRSEAPAADRSNGKVETKACVGAEIERYVSNLGTLRLTNAEFEVLVNCGSQAVPALSQALRSDRSEARTSGAYALGQIGSASGAAVPALIIALEDEYLDVRTLAAYALGQIGTKAEAAVPALGRVYRNSREIQEVRDAVAQALRQIGTEQAQTILTLPLRTPSVTEPESMSVIHPRLDRNCQQPPRSWNCSFSMERIYPHRIRVVVENRVSSNLPAICKLPGIKTFLPRCR
jgi:hypothetical protein